MPVALVLAAVLAVVDRAQLEDAQTGWAPHSIAAEAGATALCGVAVGVVGLGLEWLQLRLGRLGVPVGGRRGQGEEGGRPALFDFGDEGLGSLVQLAEFLGGWGRHFGRGLVAVTSGKAARPFAVGEA